MKFTDVVNSLDEGKTIYWDNPYIGDAHIVKVDNRYKFTENGCYDTYYESLEDLIDNLKDTLDTWSILEEIEFEG